MNQLALIKVETYAVCIRIIKGIISGIHQKDNETSCAAKQDKQESKLMT